MNIGWGLCMDSLFVHVCMYIHVYLSLHVYVFIMSLHVCDSVSIIVYRIKLSVLLWDLDC